MLLRLLVTSLVTVIAACSAHPQPAHAQKSESSTVYLQDDAIEAAALSDGALYVKLTPSGINQMVRKSKANFGNLLTVYVLDQEAVSFSVVHALEANRLSIPNPSPELKTAIKPYLINTE